MTFTKHLETGYKIMPVDQIDLDVTVIPLLRSRRHSTAIPQKHETSVVLIYESFTFLFYVFQHLLFQPPLRGELTIAATSPLSKKPQPQEIVLHLHSLSNHIASMLRFVCYFLYQEALTASRLQPAEKKCSNKDCLRISLQGTGNSFNADLKLISALQCIGTHQSSLMKATGWQAVTPSPVTTAAWGFLFILVVKEQDLFHGFSSKNIS